MPAAKHTRSKEEAYQAHLADLKVLSKAEGQVTQTMDRLLEACRKSSDVSCKQLGEMLRQHMDAQTVARRQAADSVGVYFDTV